MIASFLNNLVTLTMALRGDWPIYKNMWADMMIIFVTTAKRQEKSVSSPKAKVPAKVRTQQESKQLAAITKKIEKLEQEQKQLHLEMGEPTFYQQSPEAIAKKQKQSEKIDAELAEAYALWEKLEN